jgi:Na+-transporting NADH:ubiquinone oxidoreductase subunit C
VPKFNKESNGYIIGFALMLTLIAGGVLTALTLKLGPIQKKEIEFERKKFILSTVFGADNMTAMANDSRTEVVDMYNSLVEGKVVNVNGDLVEGVEAGAVNIKKQYKTDLSERQLPIYIVKDKDDESKVAAYVIPVYGYGLWDNIWGYVALENDLNTISGVVMDHKGETPGLGARITEVQVQERYQGKSLFDEAGNLVSVNMMKGESGDYSNNNHAVNGMSGATITGDGVNSMMKAYFESYQEYFNKIKN